MTRILGLAAMALAASAQSRYIDTNLTVEGTINHCGADTGSANAFVCANPAGFTISAYRDGVSYSFRSTHANSGAATLSIDGLSAVTIKKLALTDLIVGDIANSMEVVVKYNASSGFFEMQTPTATGGVTIVEDINLPVAGYDANSGSRATGTFDIVGGASTASYSNGNTGTLDVLGTIQFPNTNSPTILHRRLLPSTWTGNIDLGIYWIDQCCGSGNVKWNVDLACAANNSTTGVYYDAAFSNMSFNAASSVTTASNGRLNASKITVLNVTNCAASGQLWVRIARDNTVGSNLGGLAQVEYVVLTLRRTNQ